MIYFTADLHFGHKNILKYNPKFRQYENVDDMDKGLLEHMNNILRPEDTLYILGDLSLGRKPAVVRGYLESLNCGTIKIVPGNHDSNRLLKLLAASSKIEILPPIYELRHSFANGDTYKIVMCHYPIAAWHQQARGSWMIHGHSHGSYPAIGKQLDVGWDNLGFIISIESLRQLMGYMGIVKVDHH